MSFFDAFDKLDDIIFEPIKLVTDWAREPLKGRENKRNIEKETAIMKLKEELKFKEKELHAKLKKEEKELDSELKIKKETEVHRIMSEIDELQKDKDFQRMKLVSESIMKYQKELTKLNVSAINSIGNMQLELRERAQDLVYSKTVRYKELQDLAIKEAGDDLEKILEKFPDNERMQNILIGAVDKRLANVIDTAQNFLLELNEDIKILNKSINLLTENGQNFIENHLNNFHQLQNSSNDKRIENQSNVIDVQ